MRFYQVGVPLIVVALLALLLLVLALWYRRRQDQLDREDRLKKEKAWDGTCRFDNPETGAKCQREEFHLENHYRDVNGKLVMW